MHSIVWFWTTGIHDPAWVQAVAAIGLVALTLVTLIVLSIYALDTHALANSSKLSADAAKTSADIAAGLSVPTLMVHEFGVGDVGNASAEAFFQFPKIKVTIKNYGQSPALLKWWSICFTCEDLPEIPVYDRRPGSGIHLEKAVVQPGELFTLPDLEVFQRQQFSVEDVRAIITREKDFNAYGYICYGDASGVSQKRPLMVTSKAATLKG